VLAGLDDRPAGSLEEQSRQALAQVPRAAEWARRFTRDTAISARAFRRHSAPATIHAAVEGIALACVPQPDEMLRDLLVAAIGECVAWADPAGGRGARSSAAPGAAIHAPANAAVVN
jgi:hypothetical protein